MSIHAFGAYFGLAVALFVASEASCSKQRLRSVRAGGSMSIHAFGAYFGLAVAMFVASKGSGSGHPKFCLKVAMFVLWYCGAQLSPLLPSAILGLLFPPVQVAACQSTLLAHTSAWQLPCLWHQRDQALATPHHI
jgi:hypothetical protein